MLTDIEKLRARAQREKNARKEAERILEQKSVELYRSNLELKDLAKTLETRVQERTHDMQLAFDKALKLAEVKSEFLANMSHELRTPLNGVLGMLTLLKTTELSIKQDKMVNTAVNSGELLLALINDVLDLEKLENGKIELESIEFNPTEIVQLTCEPFVNLAQSKSVELIYLIPPDIPNVIKGDPTRIKQIITNLVSNAMKFTEQGEILVSANCEDDEFVLTVSDTGIGMTPEQLDKVLDKFSQANESTTRKFGGTGLGLAICQNLVDVMQGLLSINSQYNVGTSFEIRLPIELPIELINTDNSNTTTSHKFSSTNILICFHNLHVLHYAKSFLTHWQVSNIYSANDIHELSTVLNNEALDVVIIDDSFLKGHPNSTGENGANLDITQKLITQHANAKLIVFCSSTDPCEIARSSIDLSLPVKPSELFDALIGTDLLMSGPVHNYEEPSLELNCRFDNTKVLLVEDNITNQQVASELLSLFGCQIDIANNGEEGLQAIKLTTYDLVLMDIQMPVMDGLTAAKRLRAMGEEYSSLPIIALTAHSLAGDKEKSLNAGMNDHITKPIELSELSRVLSKYVSAKQSLVKPLLCNKVVIETQYPDLNVQQSLDRVLHNVPFYIRVINQFVETTKNQLESMQSMLKTENWLELTGVAHTIKGSAANIGADVVKATAAKLEGDLKSGLTDASNIKTQLTTLASKCELVFGSIEDFKRDFPQSVESIDLPFKEVIQICETIKGSLFTDISDVDTHILQLENAKKSTSLQQVSQCIATLREGYQTFNFTQIEQMCDQIIKEVSP